MGKNKKKKGKGKGTGGETDGKGTMTLEVLNSFRRSQHMGPLLDLPETTGKLGGRTLLDSPAARKKALLDSPSSSEEDSLDLSCLEKKSKHFSRKCYAFKKVPTYEMLQMRNF